MEHDEESEVVLKFKSFKQLSEGQRNLSIVLIIILIFFLGIYVGYEIGGGFCDQIVQNLTQTTMGGISVPIYH